MTGLTAATAAATFAGIAWFATRNPDRTERILAVSFDRLAGPLLNLGCRVTDGYVALRFRGWVA